MHFIRVSVRVKKYLEFLITIELRLVGEKNRTIKHCKTLVSLTRYDVKFNHKNKCGKVNNNLYFIHNGNGIAAATTAVTIAFRRFNTLHLSR